MKKAGFKFRNVLIWVKNNSTLDLSMGYKYMYKHEICLFFNKGSKKLNSFSDTIFNEITNFKIKHPCQKPTSILREFIYNSSDINDVVFDPYMGSGSTAIAAKECERRYIGFELNETFCELCRKRLKQENLTSFLTDFQTTSHSQ